MNSRNEGIPILSWFPKRSIVLVGLMGCGKSSIGRRLAAHLALPFSDSDMEVEEAAGCSVEQIFDHYGEEDFRRGERRVIERLLEGPLQVIATGGGAFIDVHSRKIIKDKARSVWLKAELNVLVSRTTHGPRRHTRPLLNEGDPVKVLERLMEQRYPIYAHADITVETWHTPPEETVQRVLSALRNFNEKAIEQTAAS
ncbi:MAG: shikimate kinase [Alphaproteobacteria bacterium]|nr:MAG: shikimate kinase [Alphaproteobacteria bacterium]